MNEPLEDPIQPPALGRSGWRAVLETLVVFWCFLLVFVYYWRLSLWIGEEYSGAIQQLLTRSLRQ